MENKSLEEVFEQLDEIVEQLDKTEVSLEDAFGLYHKGMNLLKICNDKIDKVEKQMLILDEEVEKDEL